MSLTSPGILNAAAGLTVCRHLNSLDIARQVIYCAGATCQKAIDVD